MITKVQTEPPDQEQEYARLTLGAMGPLGDTYAGFEGETINVFGGIPGEVVEVRVVRYRRRRQDYVSGIVTRVLKPSPHRVAVPCPYFGACTGCQWQHIDYDHQLLLKQAAVQEQLSQYAGLEYVPVSPTKPSPDAFNYRNHARFTVRGEGAVGYINRITRKFVRVDDCMLMDPEINGILNALQGRCQETTQVSIRYGVNTGERIIQPTLHSGEVTVPSGQSHYREKLFDHRPLRIASPSFFQVNTKQAEEIIRLARARLELGGNELLVDAYAGVGTFAVLLAAHVRRVIAIEESKAAVKDAAVNTLGIENLEFIEGKTEDVLNTLDERPDAVILDPPRVGCHLDVLQALISQAPGRVVYISCNPETLARDLDVLAQGGFHVAMVEPIDMFPQTYHVECVATLKFGLTNGDQ